MIYLEKTKDKGDGYHFPFIDDRMRIMTYNGPFDDWLWKKYTTEFVYPTKDDVVIDCGSFVGAFSIACAKKGISCHSVEPAQSNINCIKKNIEHYNLGDLITVHKIGLGNINCTMDLNLSDLTCENSLLEPDNNMSNGKKESIIVKNTKTFIVENNIDPSKLFLKVEAEGYEPEIIVGLLDIKPRCISIDITPERNNKSPLREIQKFLSSKEYNLTITNRCLIAKLI